MGSLTLYQLGQMTFLLFAIYHIGVGIPSVLSFQFTRKVAKRLYSLEIPETVDPRYEYAIKALGYYALVIGGICLAELYVSQSAHRAIMLTALAVLLTLRATGRIFYKDLVYRAFNITWERSRWNVVFNLTVAVFICVLSVATIRE